MGDLDNQDILAIFNRLRSVLSNQVCFDCSAKNHNGASITNGCFFSSIAQGHFVFTRVLSGVLMTPWR